MKKLIVIPFLFISLLTFSQNQEIEKLFREGKRQMDLKTGIRMKYIETGDPKGKPVLLLHGYTDTGRSFQMMIAELLKLNNKLRIIAPDLRGHGASSMPDPRQCAESPEKCFTIKDFALDVLDLMDQLKIGAAYLVGHSMGSLIAQELALTHPDKFKGMILIGTFVYANENKPIMDFLMNQLLLGSWKPVLEKRKNFQWEKDAYPVLPQDLGEEVIDFLRKNWVFELAASEKYMAQVLSETIQIPLGTWIGVVKNLCKTDNRSRLENLTVPTLILWASQDNAFLEKPDQEEVKKAFEVASRKNGIPVFYKVYGKVPLPVSGMQESELGHNLQWGAPLQVAEDVNRFILNGKPVENLVFVNPKNHKEVLTEPSKESILRWTVK